VRPIPAHRAGLYGLTENRQLSKSNAKPAFIPVHRTGFSAGFNKDRNSNGRDWKRGLNPIEGSYSNIGSSEFVWDAEWVDWDLIS